MMIANDAISNMNIFGMAKCNVSKGMLPKKIRIFINILTMISAMIIMYLQMKD